MPYYISLINGTYIEGTSMKFQNQKEATIIGLFSVSIILMCLMTACGKGDKGEPGPTVYVTAPAEPVEGQAEIDALVAEENDYRLGLGQTALSSGLSCTLYTITGGTYINATNINGASQSPVLTGVVQVAT